MYRLLFQGSLSEREPLLVRDPLLVIGREETAGLCLVEHGISDQHATIERREDGYYLSDLGASAGVRVNGEPVTQHRLQSGDQIELGSVKLEFQLEHGVAVTRRRLDGIQMFAIGAVGLILVIQVVLLAWIFSQPRPKVVIDQQPATPAPVAPPAAAGPKPPTPSPTPSANTASGASAVPEPARPVVLNRMLRLVRVDEQIGRDRVQLRLIVRAQVGERELDPRVAAAAIHFFVRADSEKTLPMRTPLWLNMGGLRNFSTKTFTVRFPGTPAQYGGYVVQTYYRDAIQDIAAAPPALAERVPVTSTTPR